MGDLSNLTAAINALRVQVDTDEANYNESLDTIWMLLATMLVFFMHAGFSLLEAGTVRFKNTQNILTKNLIVVCLGFLCWYVFGYALALGVPDDPGKFAGGKNVLMVGFWKEKEKFRVWLFQGAFCATGATIVSGAMAERTQLKGFAIFTTLMTTIIYPIVVYWVWSGAGFLYYSENGKDKSVVGPPMIDFAGSGTVHLVGGIGALCGAIIVGPRIGRYDTDKADQFNGHSIPFCVLGTFFLWFGWYGFNPGSTGSMHDKATANKAALVAVNTTMAPCVAGLLVFAIRALILPPRLLDVAGFCNGILAGLVSITAACSVVEPWEAIIIGLIGGCFYQGASMLMFRLKVDDVVDAFAVHGICGCWGTLAAGLFGNPGEGMGGNGSLHGGDQFGVQLVACIIIILWVGVLSVSIMLPLRLLKMLRMGDEFQEKGADVMEHSPAKAYTDTGKDTDVVEQAC